MGLYKDRNNFSKPSKHNNNKRNKQHNNTNQNNHSNNVNNDDDNDDNNNTTKSNNGGYKLPTYYDIKIGEKNFFLSSESLNNDSPNFFTAAFFGYFQESNTSKIFIERDPVYFDMFVRYLRGYEVDWPFHNKTEMINLLADAKFYGFENLRTTLEEAFNQHFPKVVIPWKILTYAPENEPILAINIKDVELVRWDGSRLLYNANSLLKRENNISEDTLTMNSEGENDNDDDIDNNIVTDVNNNINNDNNNNNNNNNSNGSSITQIRSDPEKKLYKLEIHGRDAFATVTSSLSNGVKFENFTFKNSEEEQVFKVLSDSFRINNNNNNANANANGNANANTNNNNNNNNNNSNAVGVDNPLTLSPSLKLPFLKDTCIEIDNHKYHSYNDLSTYFSVTSIRKPGKPLYFEELVIRIDGGVHLLRAKAWTIPSYYASQPFIKPVNQHLSR